MADTIKVFNNKWSKACTIGDGVMLWKSQNLDTLDFTNWLSQMDKLGKLHAPVSKTAALPLFEPYRFHHMTTEIEY